MVAANAITAQVFDSYAPIFQSFKEKTILHLDHLAMLHANKKADRVFYTTHQEPILEHIEGVYKLLQAVGLDEESINAGILFMVPELDKLLLTLSINPSTQKLLRHCIDLHKTAQQFQKSHTIEKNIQQIQALEAFRKMILACAEDIRAVIILLASLLQTLRWYTQQKTIVDENFAAQVLYLYAPLANRLGLWQFKWEMEDLAFRFLEPQAYRQIAGLLDEKRTERQAFIEKMREKLKCAMDQAQIESEITGRPKHIYSIWKKMHGKNLSFLDLYDVRAFRIIVEELRECYSVLGVVHSLWPSIPKEFDDYISQPKPNGYQSLHTVVIADDGRAIEVQIRTRAMHQAAEFGLSAHWLYKEAGAKGYAGTQIANNRYDEKISVLRQLLEWKDEAINLNKLDKNNWQDDHIYVFTPQAQVIALPVGATALDFAYHVHTDLGHRCRGAKINGKMIPLNRPLENTQTVEIIAVKTGGPSRDWLNPHTNYVISQRARSKIKAWFNALEIEEMIQKGRQILEKILQREGKTSVSFDLLSLELGYKNIHSLLLALAKDELSHRDVEHALLQISQKLKEDHKDKDKDDKTERLDKDPARFKIKASKIIEHKSDVMISGISSLAHQLARCCKPLPGDDIIGFITKGKGVSIHRQNCMMLNQLNKQYPNRLIDCDWAHIAFGQNYLFDVLVKATEHRSLLHEINEVIMRLKFQILQVQTKSKAQDVSIVLSLQIQQNHLQQIQNLLHQLKTVKGVYEVARR
jgi:GTP pyrophosphokinase